MHDAGRPLARALRSLRVQGLGPAELAITVVCHNIPVDAITASLNPDDQAGVAFLSCDDGRPSPAGPRALALERSTARYVSFLDSDDWLEPGALAAWLDVADRDSRPGSQVAAVIAPERHATGKPVLNPPLRAVGPAALDPRRDRLPYRSALRGLYSVAAIRESGIRFGHLPGNGSDLAFSLGMWFSGRPLRFGTRTPAYVLGDDATERITRTPRPLGHEMAAAAELLESPWFARLAPRDRQLVATKFVRVHLLPGLVPRATAPVQEDTALEACAQATDFLALATRSAPGWELSLSIRDARLVRLLAAPVLDLDRIRETLRMWQSFTPLPVAFAARPLAQLRVDAPWRWVAGMLALPLRMRRPAPRPR